MRYLIVIPARGGSKGIPHKNIYPIAGKPLIEYTIESMRNVQYQGDLVVSTDDRQIAEIVRKYKNIVVIDRPENISNDTATTEAALIHALNYMSEQFKRRYDAVVTLQPTSPLRKSATIQAFLEVYEKIQDQYDALLTLTEDRSDFWLKDQTGNYVRLDPQAPRRRQERRPLYLENSAIYVTKTESLLKTGSVLGTRVNGFVIDEVEGVDINEFIDIILVESIIKQKGGRYEV